MRLKNLVLIFGSFILIGILIGVISAGIMTVNDNFDSGINSSRWTQSSDASAENGKLKITHPADGALRQGILSKFTMAGDFDVQVSYSNLNFGPFGSYIFSAVGLWALGPGTGTPDFAIERRHWPNGAASIVNNHSIGNDNQILGGPFIDAPNGEIAADSSTSGIFRIKRVGSIGYAYKSDGVTVLKSGTVGTGDAVLILYGRDDNTGGAVSGYFDNFTATFCNRDCTGEQCGGDGCGGSCAPGCSGDTSKCNSNGQCVQCLINSDCSPGQYCDETQNCIVACPQSQTLLKLQNTATSPGALWNTGDASYIYSVCYPDIFGYSSTSTILHNCITYNKIIGLNANGAAEIPSLTDYPNSVCYGNLTCRSADTSAQQSCAADEKVVMKLSSSTNAQISTDVSSNFPIKICCKEKQTYTGATSWQDMTGIPISNADLNDTVRLFISRQDVQSKNIEYNIYKIGGSGFLFWKWDKKVAQFTTQGYTTWKANQSGDYYFNASVEDFPTDIYKSNNLTVSDKVVDTLPLIIITRPNENSNYTIGSIIGKTNPIVFNATIIDPDDDINVMWNFGDGNTANYFNCLTGNDCNTTHQYSIPGTKIINVTAIETTRTNKFATNLTRIFIYNDSLVLFLIVDSPNYRLRSLSGPFRVSAKSTHVANCTGVLGECQGKCQGTGKTCYTIVDTDIIPSARTLYCYKYADSCNNKFAFTWNFDGQADTIHKNCTEFTKFFPESADHHVNLMASYNLD